MSSAVFSKFWNYIQDLNDHVLLINDPRPFTEYETFDDDLDPNKDLNACTISAVRRRKAFKMGLTLGVKYVAVGDDNCTKCIPSVLYRKFPPEVCKTSGKLILDVLALPRSCHVAPRPEGAYWWTDGQFTPNDDGCIYVTCAAFQPRSNSAWIKHKRMPVGRIMRVSLNNGTNPTGFLFRGSTMSHFPKVQTHPSGNYVGYVGAGSVMITTRDHEEVYNKMKDLRNYSHKFCAFSPDGKHLAILQTGSRRFELMVSWTARATSFNDDSVDLTSILPGFKGGLYNEHLECKWSPDSKFIAVCSSINYLFIMNKKLELVVDIVDEILPNVFPSWSGTFDYDPRHYHELLAVGANDRRLYVVNTVKKTVVLETEPLSKDAIDCVLYSPSGGQIAVSVRDFNIFLLDSCTGSLTFNIDMRDQCPTLQNTFSGFPSVMRLCFSSRGDHLATSSCDGIVRVWQLPAEMSLFSLCKWEILSQVPASRLKHLPLPQKIIDMLLSMPVSAESFKLVI